MALKLLFAFIGIGIIFLILKLANIVYKYMLIPVEMVDAGMTDAHIASHTTKSPVESVPKPVDSKSNIHWLESFWNPASYKATNVVYTISPFESFYHDGKKVNPKKYIIKKANGDCMVPRNIHAGDLLFIEKFGGDVNTLSIGDILFIQKEDGYKIREYRGIRDSQTIYTLLYLKEGNTKKSEHELSKVKGMVRMRFASN
jgi:hypothetical protein